jgi:hypothetical protein
MAELEIKPSAASRGRVVGVIIGALIIGGTQMYLLTAGDILAPKATLVTYMPDSEGLAINSPVRLSGIKIGVVQHVDLSPYLDTQRSVRVDMRVRASYLPNIPSDSQTAISADTLIGDKVVTISEGKSVSPITDGGILPSEPVKQAADKADLIRAIGNELRSVDTLMANLSSEDNPTGRLIMGDAEYQSAMRQVSGFSQTIHSFVSPESVAGQWVFDPNFYTRIHQPLVQLDQQLNTIEASKLIASQQQYDDLLAQVRKLRTLLSNTHLDRDTPAYAKLQDALKQADSLVSNLNLGRTNKLELLQGQLLELEKILRNIREDPKKYLRFKPF